MEYDLKQFANFRPKDRTGFRWEWNQEYKEEELVWRWSTPEEGITSYPLRDHSGLFRTFLALRPTKHCFLEFANQYGRITHFDLLPRLQYEHQRFRLVVDLRYAIQSRDEKTIETLLKGIVQNHPFTGGHGPYVSITGAEEMAEIALASRAEFRNTGQSWLAYISQSYWVYVNEALEATVGPPLVRGDAAGELRLVLQPHCLLGGLWLQFAEAIAGQKQYHQCRECKQWFEVGGGTKNKRSHRIDKTTCSDACRVRNNRKRQAQAIEMHRKRKPTRLIAKALDVKEELVVRWIAQAKEKHA